MSSTFKNLLVLIITVMALTAGFWAAEKFRQPDPVPPAAALGSPMINFTLPDLDGNNRSLEEWRGKVIVVNFWATWCPPCREEIPLLVDLQNRHGARGIQVLGVAIDSKTAVMLYRQSINMNYPSLIADEATLSLLTRYGNSTGSLPFSIIIDRQGRIASRKLGAYTKTELENEIGRLLG